MSAHPDYRRMGGVSAWIIATLLVVVFLVGLTQTVRKTASPPASAFPKPDHVWNSQRRTCMVYTVEGSTKQYWQCSDGCEYIGTWKVETEKSLVCPGKPKAAQ